MWPRYSLEPSFVHNFIHDRIFLKKKIWCILCVGTTTAPCGIVICPVQTNKTSNSIPSVIKGYLDRNINISLKLNQMLLHGGRQDSKGKRNTEKQGRYFTQESESVPRLQHLEMFIPPFLRPPSPWTPPPNLEQRDIPEEKKPPSLDLILHRLSHETCKKGNSATARTGEEV